jgi:peptide/nickel transport system ATP-binding protein
MLPLLSVRDLHLRFKLFEGTSHVLNGVDFEIDRGERVAIVGESGCGKSVTLKLIMGLVRGQHVSTTGSVRFDGRELLGAREAQLRELRGRRICPIYQDPMASLNPTYTIFDQMATVIRRGRAKRSAEEVREIARGGLRRVAITDPDRVLAAYPFQLSGGLNQRVLISMALANEPDLVLADEPGTALDVTVQEQTLRLMRNLTDDLGSAVLLITHNLGVVRQFADRVYVMYAGNIVEEGPTERVFADPRHPYTRALLASVPKLTGGALPEGIEGHVPDYTRPPSGCRFHPRCPHAQDACRSPQALRPVGEGHRAACVLYEEPVHA